MARKVQLTEIYQLKVDLNYSKPDHGMYAKGYGDDEIDLDALDLDCINADLRNLK
jgi:hypothetical protein